MTLTLLPYITAALFLSFTTASVGLPMLIFVVFHFCIWRWSLGTGMLDEVEYDVYYSLAFGMHAIAGYLLAWVLAVHPVPRGWRRSRLCSDEAAHAAHYPKVSLKDEKYFTKADSKGVVKVHKSWWFAGCVYRTAIMLASFACIIGGIMAFEFLTGSLVWLGLFLAITLALVGLVIFFIGLSRLPAMPFKVLQGVYLYAKKPENRCILCSEDMTSTVTIYLGIQVIVTILVFGLVSILASTFWQFFIAIVIFGGEVLWCFFLRAAVLRDTVVWGGKGLLNSQ